MRGRGWVTELRKYYSSCNLLLRSREVRRGQRLLLQNFLRQISSGLHEGSKVIFRPSEAKGITQRFEHGVVILRQRRTFEFIKQPKNLFSFCLRCASRKARLKARRLNTLRHLVSSECLENIGSVLLLSAYSQCVLCRDYALQLNESSKHRISRVRRAKPNRQNNFPAE